MPAGLRAQQTHLERKTRSRLRTFRLTAVQLNAGLQQRQRTDSFLLASPGLSERRRRQQLTRTPYGHDPPRWPPRAGRTPVAPAGPRPLGTAPHCSALRPPAAPGTAVPRPAARGRGAAGSGAGGEGETEAAGAARPRAERSGTERNGPTPRRSAAHGAGERPHLRAAGETHRVPVPGGSPGRSGDPWRLPGPESGGPRFSLRGLLPLAKS